MYVLLFYVCVGGISYLYGLAFIFQSYQITGFKIASADYPTS